MSVGDLARRYEVSRNLVQKVLQRMQEDGLVERTPGHLWVFGPALNDEESYNESYRYRLVCEPAALREPGYHLAEVEARRLRSLHQTALDAGLENETTARLFAIDADFHETIARASGNRFLARAVVQQTRLRRLCDYETYTSREIHTISFREHLAILDAIGEDNTEAAASLMHAHILRADTMRPDFRKVRVLAHRRLTRR